MNNLLINNDYLQQSEYFFEASLYYILWSIFYLYINKILQKYPVINYLPPDKRVEGKTRIYSSLHAIILSTWSISYLRNIIEYKTWCYMLPLSGAFGLFDICIITLNYKNFKNQYFGIATHHLIVIFGPLLLLRENNSRIIAQSYLFEMTVPILDISWYLYYTGLNNTILFKINSLITLFLFLFCRVCNNIYLVYSTIYEKKYALTIVGIYLLYLNVTWFNIVIKHLQK